MGYRQAAGPPEDRSDAAEGYEPYDTAAVVPVAWFILLRARVKVEERSQRQIGKNHANSGFGTSEVKGMRLAD